ncbi:SAM-dependent methyltransferase [Saccharopolyspora endophytica]|uniref:SAM-dependent methyltransferase n=1 Tax=Saccharopolyspora endophytica TaxID=543886 RepID=A0ABS5DK41_9PSEU|nr:SAM-dependent methyltransferase [Saccharopolyspora endophytica]
MHSAPGQIDSTRASIARVYDRFLGGKDNLRSRPRGLRADRADRTRSPRAGASRSPLPHSCHHLPRHRSRYRPVPGPGLRAPHRRQHPRSRHTRQPGGRDGLR